MREVGRRGHFVHTDSSMEAIKYETMGIGGRPFIATKQ